MTEKELLYFEDAIGHTSNIIKLLNDFINKVEDEKIKTFIEEEREKIYTLKSNLINVLGGKANG